MTKELMIGSIGLALFIICPRMAGMVHIISKHSNASLMQTALLGSVLSIPLVLLIVLVFGRYGLWGALAFCILTDLGAALFMKQLSLKAGVETFIIAVFVILGVKVAPLITNLLIKQ